MKYRVKNGVHIEGGKQYAKGSIVESDLKLDTLFREKFEVVTAAPVPAAPSAPSKPSGAAKGGKAAPKAGAEKKEGGTEDWGDDK